MKEANQVLASDPNDIQDADVRKQAYRCPLVDRRGTDAEPTRDLADHEELFHPAVQLVEVRHGWQQNWQQNFCEACRFLGIVGLRCRSSPEWFRSVGDPW